MAICDIAGLKVDIKNIKGRTEKQAVPYYSASQSENQKADITINVTPERIKAAMAEHERTSGTCAGRLGIYAYRQ